MSKIHYVIGDVLKLEYKPNNKNVIIPHICNDKNGWGAGFVVALSKKFWTPEHDYREWYRAHMTGLDKPGKYGPFELGAVQFVYAGNDIIVANMIAQHDTRWHGFIPPIRYKALESCLDKVATKAKGIDASIHAPRFGAGLAGGTWSIIEDIIKTTLIKNEITTYIYDLPV